MICDGITTYYTLHLHYSTLSIFSIYPEESSWRTAFSWKVRCSFLISNQIAVSVPLFRLNQFPILINVFIILLPSLIPFSPWSIFFPIPISSSTFFLPSPIPYSPFINLFSILENPFLLRLSIFIPISPFINLFSIIVSSRTIHFATFTPPSPFIIS